MKIKNIKMIEVWDWDELVQETYGRPYSFQQQEGCKSRGTFNLTIPSKWAKDEDNEMNDEISEEINGEEMGVKFKKWLERDPKQLVDGRDDYAIGLFWERNFYPTIEIVANDLHAKGLIEAGEYIININW